MACCRTAPKIKSTISQFSFSSVFRLLNLFMAIVYHSISATDRFLYKNDWNFEDSLNNDWFTFVMGEICHWHIS